MESREFGGVHLDDSFLDDEAKEVNLGFGKGAFFRFEEQVVVTEFLEDATGEALKLVLSVSEDEDIVHVDDNSSFADFFFKEEVHHRLESGRGVGQAEEHNGRFKQSLIGDKGGLLLVSVIDPYVVVAPLYVDFGEVLGALEFVEEVGDSRERVSVSNGSFVKLSIVLTGTEGPIFLGDQEEWCGLRGE
jgi:hypothetical protein